ncbi:hypothetical protein RvY_08612 [Ramazzottius varieornatus]|uniref:Chitin-binding type-2 domain-containing protein n=1 Tax=Ramazzottius varieornatus TaxID=947166 RepID=A0A1D1V6F8_RAMVA|nr:hypothetical protein RvY_08612 [Ramazzottius varieornatus]
MLWLFFIITLLLGFVANAHGSVPGRPMVLSTQDVRTISKDDRFPESDSFKKLWRIKRRTPSGDRRPASYVSELSGLTCSVSGYFPHPTNNTKFFRCVALQSQSNYMVYLFTCDAGLVYEPTVKACVKALGEESMEAAASLDATVISPWRVSATDLNTTQEGISSTLLSDSLRRWQVSRCRDGFQNKASASTTLLFRSPINCRRFIRCSTIATTLKIEQFSCPTGLFFDEEKKLCTWATSQTSVCNMTLLDNLDNSLPYKYAAATSAPSIVPPGTLATIWMTPSPSQPSFTTPSPTVLEDVVRVFTLPYGRERESVAPTTRTPSVTTTSTGFSHTVGVSLQTNNGDNGENSQSTFNFQPIIKPMTYLTATGVLVTDGEDFRCGQVGVFSTANPCVFFKCEKYVWMEAFLLFRFQCPPHTAFHNGTCQYDAEINCGIDGTVFDAQAGTFISSSDLKNQNTPSVPQNHAISASTPNSVDDSTEEESFTPFLLPIATQSPDVWTLPDSLDEVLSSSSTSLPSSPETETKTTNLSPEVTENLQLAATERATTDSSTTDDNSANFIEIKSIPLTTPTPAPISVKPGVQKPDVPKFAQKAQPVCFSSGYFLYPSDETCQRFYRCLQLTPEPNSFVMLHYRCDGPFVFDTISHACMAPASASNPCQSGLGLDILPELMQPSAGTTTTTPIKTASTVSSHAPQVVLPKVWQTGSDGVQDGAAPLVCTTQQVYRLQTCGYYYSCLEVEKGRFRLQEIYCETLYLNVTSGQCVAPPSNDPCRPEKDYTNPTTTVTSTTSSTNVSASSTSLNSPSTTATSSFTTGSSTRTQSTRRPGGVTMSLPLPSTMLNPWRNKEPRPTVSSWIGNKAVAIKVPGKGSLEVSSQHDTYNDRTSVQLSLTSYRNTFNKLYAQMSDWVTPSPPTSFDQTLIGPMATTTPSALILNFNTVSGQLNNITTGMSFKCRSEGYFRNARDVSCSKFYLCVKVGPKQYNLFEFMCLPHNGIQWRYNQHRNQCVDPQDVNEC